MDLKLITLFYSIFPTSHYKLSSEGSTVSSVYVHRAWCVACICVGVHGDMMCVSVHMCAPALSNYYVPSTGSTVHPLPGDIVTGGRRLQLETCKVSGEEAK